MSSPQTYLPTDAAAVASEMGYRHSIPAALLSSSISSKVALVWFCSSFRGRPAFLRRFQHDAVSHWPLIGGVAFFSGAAQAQQNVGAAGKMVTFPMIPERARVTLDPKTTALMVLDYVEPICNAPSRVARTRCAGEQNRSV